MVDVLVKMKLYTHCEVLEEPCLHYVSCRLGEDASLLLGHLGVLNILITLIV